MRGSSSGRGYLDLGAIDAGVAPDMQGEFFGELGVRRARVDEGLVERRGELSGPAGPKSTSSARGTPGLMGSSSSKSAWMVILGSPVRVPVRRRMQC